MPKKLAHAHCFNGWIPDARACQRDEVSLIGSDLPSILQPSRAAAATFVALHTGMRGKVYIKPK